MAKGKSISLFLIDSTPSGVVACELSNWTGKGYKIPRSLLKEKDVSNRSDLKKTGVYFLFGRDENDSEVVYIGEAEDVYNRLLQHLDKEFWTESVIFISKDENLNKAHVKYLESHLHSLALVVSRYIVMNSNIPTKPSISEMEQSVMTEFAENLCLLLGAMGYKLFERLTTSKVHEQDVYYICSGRGADAKAVITPEGIVVVKGSRIAQTEVDSIQTCFKTKREKLQTDGIIKGFVFIKDYLFSSPSTAAATVLGRSANGLIEWKRKDGKTIKDIQFQPKEP